MTPRGIPFWATPCSRCEHTAADHAVEFEDDGQAISFHMKQCQECDCPAFQIAVKNPRTCYRLIAPEGL